MNAGLLHDEVVLPTLIAHPQGIALGDLAKTCEMEEQGCLNTLAALAFLGLARGHHEGPWAPTARALAAATSRDGGCQGQAQPATSAPRDRRRPWRR